LIAVRDTIKENAVAILRLLESMGIETAMLTGDNKHTAKAIAKELGIKKVFSEVLPQDKAHHVKSL